MNLEKIIKYSGYLSSGLFILIGFIVSFEVISRYIFNAPTIWVNEISRFLQIWATYLALTYSFHKNDFIRITVIYDRLGEFGKKILDSVSKGAWQMWLDHQTMLINENNLNLFEESSQAYLKEQMEKYFFSDNDLDQIKGYIPK